MKKSMLVLAACLFLPAAAQVYHGVAVAPDGQNAWVVQIDTIGVMHTTDFGQTWRPETIPTIRNMWDVCATDPLNVWTCGMTGDIWHSSDGGGTWARQCLGGPKHAARIRFVNGTHGWAAGGDLCQLGTVDATEWTQEILPGERFPVDTLEFNGVSFANTQLGWIVSGRWPAGDTYSGGQGWIVRTIDRGDSWELQRKDTTFDYYDCWFVDEQTGWVAGGDDRNFRPVILKTTDGGATWVQQALPPAAQFLRSLFFISATDGWACGRSGTILHTTDAGLNWALQTTHADTTLFDIEFADSLRGMAAGSSVVLYTTDGGENWIRCLGGVAEPARPPARRPVLSLRVGHNPAAGQVRLSLSGTGRYELGVFDAAGRVVRSFRGGLQGPGTRLIWDGRDSNGERARAGLYRARLATADGTRTAGFVYLR